MHTLCYDYELEQLWFAAVATTACSVFILSKYENVYILLFPFDFWLLLVFISLLFDSLLSNYFFDRYFRSFCHTTCNTMISIDLWRARIGLHSNRKFSNISCCLNPRVEVFHISDWSGASWILSKFTLVIRPLFANYTNFVFLYFTFISKLVLFITLTNPTRLKFLNDFSTLRFAPRFINHVGGMSVFRCLSFIFEWYCYCLSRHWAVYSSVWESI